MAMVSKFIEATKCGDNQAYQNDIAMIFNKIDNSYP